MANMTNRERALSYLRRLKEAQNKLAEANSIRSEIDTLIWTESKKPLTLEEKLSILKEVKELLNQEILLERRGGQIVKASDNSGVIDVIDSIENDLKRRNS